MGFRYNGSHSDDHHIATQTQQSILPSIQAVTQTIPGRPGAYYFGSEYETRQIIVTIWFSEDDLRSYHDRLRDLAAWLDPGDEPKELILDNEPDKTYFAVLSGTTDIEKIAWTGQGTLTFICPDPFAYGPTRTQLIHDPGGDPEANPIIENNGTAPTYPTFRATVLEPITFLDIISPDDYMRIGRPIDVVEEVPFEREQRLMWDDMSSTVGWTDATEIDGAVSGSMESDGSRFQPVDFGSGSGWHGPAMKTSVPDGPIQDFRMDAIVGFWNKDPAIVGRVEIYLLDDQNRVVAKIAMKDTRNGAPLAWGEARLGDSTVNYHMIDEYGDRPGNWNDFYGMLRLERIGNKWWARIAKIDQNTGRHHTIRSVRWPDEDNVFNRNVAQVVVHFGQYGSHVTGGMGVYDIKVWRINQAQQNQIPYIAMPDDIIEFNHQRNLITKNGEKFMSYNGESVKDFAARFFPIHPGLTEIAVQPEEAVTVQAELRDAYK